MNKDEFFNKLKNNLKYLSKKERKQVLQNYENMNTNDLDPVEEANKIYNNKGLKITITKQISFFDALNIIIKNIELKDKEIIKSLIFFALYLLFLLIVIKIPFIYTRDMIGNLFNNLFTNNNTYILYSLFFELIYALTCIIIFIKIIKKKALELEKNVTNN